MLQESTRMALPTALHLSLNATRKAALCGKGHITTKLKQRLQMQPTLENTESTSINSVIYNAKTAGIYV